MAFSNLEKAMAAVIGLDIARPGTSRAAAKRAVAMLGRTAIPAARTAARVNPYAAAGLTGLAAYELGLLDPLAQPAMQAVEAIDEVIVQAPERRRKKRRTQFNRAVSEGMKAVKKAASYGKKGTINNAKKAFAAVNKVASKVNRGKKVSTKGITGKIARAVRGKL